MKSCTDFDNVQQSEFEFIGLRQITSLSHADQLSLPNPDSIEDLESFTIGSFLTNSGSIATGYQSPFEVPFDRRNGNSKISSLAQPLLNQEVEIADYFPLHRPSFNQRTGISQYPSFPDFPFDQNNVTYNSQLNQFSLSNYGNAQDNVTFAPIADHEINTSPDDSQQHFTGDQIFINSYPEHSMAAETPAIVTPIDSGSTVSYTPELRCSDPQCPQDLRFSSEAALNKHQAKHSKPYICQVPNCKHPRFGDKGGLDRHSREVHGSQTHCCPITSCNRHTRGFPRKYNLIEHQKRCHSSLSPESARSSVDGSRDFLQGNTIRPQGSYNGSPSWDFPTGGEEWMREKLEGMRKQRAELDMDIKALERTLNLVEEDS